MGLDPSAFCSIIYVWCVCVACVSERGGERTEDCFNSLNVAATTNVDCEYIFYMLYKI